MNELASHGGDGGVCIVFKQQKLADVIKEFTVWQEKRFPVESHRLKFIENSGGLFSDMCNENIRFEEWADYRTFLKNINTECGIVPITEGEKHVREVATTEHWDTVIITW